MGINVSSRPPVTADDDSRTDSCRALFFWSQGGKRKSTHRPNGSAACRVSQYDITGACDRVLSQLHAALALALELRLEVALPALSSQRPPPFTSKIHQYQRQRQHQCRVRAEHPPPMPAGNRGGTTGEGGGEEGRRGVSGPGPWSWLWSMAAMAATAAAHHRKPPEPGER